jgi:probable dihydroxyacetone kinase regulator
MSDSLITKKAMAESIKELMKKKSLEKITVSDIVKNCGLNRQTFYYHFKDKYDLLDWIYNNEVVTLISSISAGTDWSVAMLNILSIMRKEKTFYVGSLNFDRQNMFHDFLFTATRDMLVKVIQQQNAREKLEMDASSCIFIAEFYTYGLVGMVIQWAKNGMKETPEEIVGKLMHFIDDSKLVSTMRDQKQEAKNDAQAANA